VSAQPFELTFDNVLAEHLAAERLYYRSTRLWKLDKLVAMALVCFGGCLTLVAGLCWWSVIWFPLAIAEWFNLFSLRPVQIWYLFKHNPKFRETYHLTIDENALSFRTRSIDSRIQWDLFSSFLENNRVCLLVYGPQMYSVIPKRAFKTEADLEVFRTLVRAKIGRGKDAPLERGAPEPLTVTSRKQTGSPFA
jgi:hypothetical protein